MLVGEIEELPELLALRGEAEVRFDAIVGRNALGALPDKAAALRQLAGWLQPGGRLSLAETVVRHSQRLYDLVDLSSLGDDLRQRVVEAEEAIYADGGDPLVNWDADELAGRAGSRRLWGDCRPGGDARGRDAGQPGDAGPLVRRRTPSGQRPSYAQHLLRRLTADELAEVGALFHRQLAGQTVPWRTRIVFVSGQILDN